MKNVNELWEEFGDVPIDDNGDIEEKYLHFEKGTSRLEIWHWFEEKFKVSVAEDLMGLKE